MFEYFFLHMFYYDYIVGLSYKYWIVMWFFPIFFSYLIIRNKFNIGILCLLIHIFGLLEDISYFIGYGIQHNVYPYPVSDWYDSTIGSFKLFHFGTPISFFPYVPVFYIYYMCNILIYICLFSKEKHSYINLFNIYIVPTTICQIFLPPKWDLFIIVWLCLVFIMILIYRFRHIFKRPLNLIVSEPDTIELNSN